MKIQIDASSIYERLMHPEDNQSLEYQFYERALKNLKEGESWKTGSTPIREKPVKSRAFCEDTGLIFPFEHAKFNFYRTGGLYTGSLCLNTRFLEEARDIIKLIPEKIKQLYGKSYFSRNSNLVDGYLLSPEGQPLMDIKSIDPSKIYFNMGDSGTIERPCGSIEDFFTDVGMLEKVVNHVLNSGIDLAVKAKVIPENPDLVIPMRSI